MFAKNLRRALAGGVAFTVLSWGLRQLGEPAEHEEEGRTLIRSRLRMLYKALMHRGISDAPADKEEVLFPDEEYGTPQEAFTGLEELMFLTPPSQAQWDTFWMAVSSHPCGEHLAQQLELETMIFHTPWGWLLIRPDIANICMPYGSNPEASLQRALTMIAQCAVREESHFENAEA